ncbi:hypothetical protein BV25DRAFT_1833351 [Artomyces pyxidatus]|uniref:Uncharacterized protein n=1 Tax=Artomyces pyxidatus TaxID=48021 RepID=A0ACB8SHI6_9AGAM|nr:hypothetical protein BV25DRAFT_1833351 [Artomyces pyxidatus]
MPATANEITSAKVVVETATAVADSAVLGGEDLETSAAQIGAGRYIIAGLIFLALSSGLFVLLGGLRWVRRVYHARGRGHYRKVGDDVEK